MRYRWLVVLAAVVAGGAGYVTWRVVDPEYEAEANIWVQPDEKETLTSPFSEGGLLAENAWLELVRSFAVLDPVVMNERLYLEAPGNYRWLFGSFSLGERFRPGRYRLTVAEDGRSWALATSEGVEVARGVPGDSIAPQLGFQWRPRPEALVGGTDFEFTLVTPRDASRKLSEELTARMDKGANFIGLTLRGKDPAQIASILNSLMDQYVDLAANLKRRKLDERRTILEEQLVKQESELTAAEGQLERFRVATVTLPTDASNPIAPGLEQTRDPVFNHFFEMKVEQEQLGRDRQRLERFLAVADTGAWSLDALQAVSSTRGSSELARAMDDLVKGRADLRVLRERYQDGYRPIQDLLQAITTLEQETIPRLVRNLVEELASRESSLEDRIEAAGADMSNIPVRSIEEARLRRQVEIQVRLYNELRERVETTRLASAAAIPDISILDNATPPQVPANDERIRMMLVAMLGVLGVGVMGAVVLDRMDATLRDPTEVADDLGIGVLGAVPKIGTGKAENEERVLEAFRVLRMNVQFAYGSAGPLVMAVSSPSQGEGKSLVSANLAVAFAEIGHRTLLIDGDTRQGDVHLLLGAERKPGLTDMLTGAELGPIVQSTYRKGLDFIASGSRFASSPELLAGSRMRELLSEARGRYDVIIVDSPPLTAGADAALLAALTGSLALVVRSGSTARAMVQAKLEGLRVFPIRVLGAVLNEFAENGHAGYYYYSNYLPGYEARNENEAEPAPAATGT